MSISEHVSKVNKLLKCYNLPIYIKLRNNIVNFVELIIR